MVFIYIIKNNPVVLDEKYIYNEMNMAHHTA